MLKVQNLSKVFQLSLNNNIHVDGFENISFHVPKGKFLGIAGPSGIGKSSILKCIYRTYTPTSGNILYQSPSFGEVNLANAQERLVTRLRRNEISFVSQFLRVIPRVPAVDIVAEQLLPFGIPPEEANERAIEMLRRFRIREELFDASPATFSGGEQQRVNLARAFIKRPNLLILDEPTASLDLASKKNVLEILKEMKECGTTMVGVFHDWDVMEEIADDIMDLRDVQAVKSKISGV